MLKIHEIYEKFANFLTKLPMAAWLAVFVCMVAIAVAVWLEMEGPPYTAISEGLNPAEGGKVIAELQKLGIPYKLDGNGNIISVPDDMVGQARLELGSAKVPGSDAEDAVTALENAPLASSDLAQQTLAKQALELSITQSIEGMQGIQSAQVFIATPDETPFLSDSPRPTASVIIGADPGSAASDAQAIANIVAGAVPGISPRDITIQTLAGNTVYPTSGALNESGQLQLTQQLEASIAARVNELLAPVLGTSNFHTEVTAEIDFTQESIHQITYGPGHDIAHHSDTISDKDVANSSYGIPGALSNEPPTPTTAQPQTSTGQATAVASQPPSSSSHPRDIGSSSDQIYLTEERDEKISEAPWTLQSLAISVVVNEGALSSGINSADIRRIIAGAFSNEPTTVFVFPAQYAPEKPAPYPSSIVQNIPYISRSVFELIGMITILFGVAVPVGRRISEARGTIGISQPVATQSSLRIGVPSYSELKNQVADNIPAVARLLQSWVDENDS
jgi:flagellar M-ring protein FliF